MSTTQTSHEPTAGELAAHATDDHAVADPGGDDHGGEHGHGETALGPLDLAAWGALVLGIGAGLVVVLCLYVTTVLLAGPVAG